MVREILPCHGGYSLMNAMGILSALFNLSWIMYPDEEFCQCQVQWGMNDNFFFFFTSAQSNFKMEVTKKRQNDKNKYEQGFLSIPAPRPLKFLCLALKLKWKSASLLTMTNPVCIAISMPRFLLCVSRWIFLIFSPALWKEVFEMTCPVVQTKNLPFQLNMCDPLN